MEAAADNKPLYNSRIIDTFIRLIKTRYPFVNVSELLENSDMQSYQVADQGHWFTQSQVDTFYELASRLTGNPDLAREAGRYAASPDTIGVMRQYILSMVGPANVYELVNKSSTTLTRSSLYTSRKLASNIMEITVTPCPGVQEKPFQCENRIGFFESVAMMFQNRLPHVDHPECIFKGDKVCRYIIIWGKPRFSPLEEIGYALCALIIVMVSIYLCADAWTALESALPVFTIIALLILVFRQKHQKAALQERLDNFRGASDKLIEQIDLIYTNAQVTGEIGRAISRQTKIDDILASVVNVLETRLDYDRGLILLANPERTKLVFRAGFGYPRLAIQTISNTSFHLNRPESQGVFVVSMREQKPFLVNNVNELDSRLSARSLEYLRKLGAKSFICCPIICEGESIGILAVDNLNSERTLLQSDINLLMGIAPVIGITIHNANLLEAKFSQFSSFLKVMAASIDARDPLTAGHSEKVTEYSVEICKELGLGEDDCEMIRVAALLHDYGKIGVPDAILKKNGRLTDMEYEIVKTHCYKTRDILDQVNFEGIYRQVPEIAGSHHEKIDGTGYPRGLKGKDIPLGAKIIAVADFYEAVTSMRHYRDPMPVEEAVRLLREGSGTHFDKRIVEALIACRERAVMEELQNDQAETGLHPRQEIIGV